MPSPIGASHAHIPVSKADRPLNPAQQARAADPTAKGAAFGELVSGFAKARHAPPPAAAPPPPAVIEPPATAETGSVIDISA